MHFNNSIEHVLIQADICSIYNIASLLKNILNFDWSYGYIFAIINQLTRQMS